MEAEAPVIHVSVRPVFPAKFNKRTSTQCVTHTVKGPSEQAPPERVGQVREHPKASSHIIPASSSVDITLARVL